MMKNLDLAMANVRFGRETQFAPLVQIPAAKLVSGVFVEIDLPQACSTLFLPQTVVTGAGLVENPSAVVLGVKLNVVGAPVLPWGRASNLFSRFDGPVEKIFVTLLSGTAADIYLLGMRNVDLFYSGNFAGAGTPDNTTTNPA